MQPQVKRRLRLWLIKLHRQAGIASALIVCLITITGILLNHVGDLELDRQYPQQGVLLSPYQSVLSSAEAVPNVQLRWNTLLIGTRDHALYVNDKLQTDGCEFIGPAAATEDQLLIVCPQQWLLLSSEGQLLDLIEPDFFVLPDSWHLVADRSSFYIVDPSNDQYQQLDLDTYFLTVGPQPTALLPNISRRQLESSINNEITWERFLLDLHSGRWFGSWGVWVVDIAAIMLLILALSGSWIWLSRNRSRRRSKRSRR